jgi:hypothetical protein
MPPSSLTSAKSGFRLANTIYTDSLSTYKSLIDKGNTDSLVNAIYSNHNPSSLFSMLMSVTPYLSDTAVKSTVLNSALSNSQFMTVLQNNPDVLRNAVFLTSLKSMYSFTTANLDSITAWARHYTRRGRLENAFQGSRFKMDEDANTILMALKSALDTLSGAPYICTDTNNIYYGLDSNSFYYGIDSVVAWLQNIGKPWAQLAEAGAYDFLGQYQNAQHILNVVDSTNNADVTAGLGPLFPDVDLASDTLLENTIIRAAENGRNILQLDSNELAVLSAAYMNELDSLHDFTADFGLVSYEIISGGGTPPCLLCTRPTPLPFMSPCPPVLIPWSGARKSNTNTGDSSLQNNTTPAISNLDINSQFTVYPNPTTGMVTFSYNMPSADGNTGHLIITNIVGEEVAGFTVNGTTGKLYWDASPFAAGIYVYKFTQADGKMCIGKIVVSR